MSKSWATWFSKKKKKKKSWATTQNFLCQNCEMICDLNLRYVKTQKSKLAAAAWWSPAIVYPLCTSFTSIISPSSSSTQHNCIAYPFVNLIAMMKYNLYFIYSILLLVVLLQQHPSKAQQPYVGLYTTSCNQGLNITNGFKCNGVETSCESYLTFRSTPAYDSPLSIAPLLGADFSFIAEINNITISQKIPTDTQTIIPVDCSCLGDEYYQHNSSYQVRLSDTFFTIANDTYQGLTTCHAIMRENSNTDETLGVGVNVNVPLRCACPTPNQTASGFKYLLTYMVTQGDTIATIADVFGADTQSIVDANELLEDSIIFPFTPLLVPLKSKPPISIVKSVILGNHSCQIQFPFSYY